MPIVSLRWNRPIVGPGAALLWMVLFAFSSPVVFYSGRVKQYPTEALGSATIIAVFLAIVALPQSRAQSS